MHVVIDLGEKHSSLVCWEKGTTLEDASIKIKLPGLAIFRSTENCWQRDHMQAYFSFIYREYLLPCRIIIESAALAIPSIMDLNTRRMMLDILEEIFGLYEAAIIPHSLALIAGTHMHTPLWGDVMVIEAKESAFYNFSFISIIEAIGITLEKQINGGISEILEQAQKQGYHSAKGWQCDHLLLTGSHAKNLAIEKFIASLDSTVNVINAPDLDFTAAEGLSVRRNEKSIAALLPLNVIYPFEFYLEKNNSTFWERILFDTANLELNCSDQYRMISLDHTSIHNLSVDGNRVHFRIYELMPAVEPRFHKPHQGLLPVLEIDIPLDDLPPHIELRLDMSAAAIQLDFKTDTIDHTTPIPIVFESRLKANQQKLYDTLSKNKQGESLLRDWNNYLLSSSENSHILSDQIDQTLFHLYGLLQLWQVK